MGCCRMKIACQLYLFQFIEEYALYLRLFSKIKGKSMTQEAISISDLIHRVSEENSISFEVVNLTWEVFTKYVVFYAKNDKSILIFDSFYIIEIENNTNRPEYRWIPTHNFQEDYGFSLDKRLQKHIGFTIILNSEIFLKFLQSENIDMNEFNLKEAIVYKILWKVIEKIKSCFSEKAYLEIDLEYFGFLEVKNGVYFQRVNNEDVLSMNVKKLVTPKSRKTSLFRVSKRESQKGGTMVRRKMQFQINKKQNYKEFLEIQLDKFHQENKEKTWVNRYITPDIKIPCDLLGAGLDPLKAQYTHSKLVNKPHKLMQKTFNKTKPGKMRYPGIIDKFERTGGAPQTGLKISSSIVVRIGSNYNPLAKILYNDLSKKRILYVPDEPRIDFLREMKEFFVSATEEEEYKYLIQHKKDLCDPVRKRIKTHERYQNYIEKYIDNDNVAPLPKKKIKNFLQAATSFLNKTQVKNYHQIMENVLNEINVNYYYSYKKSILDYILKDDNEKKRTGIDIIFKKKKQWGCIIKAKKEKEDWKGSKFMIEKAKKNLQRKYLHFPKCILEISTLNKKIEEIDFFDTKHQESKPVNVLYFIKKQNTHISEVISYLSTTWTKNIAEIMKKNIAIDEEPERKIESVLKLVNVMMSNTLKTIIIKSLKQIKSFFEKYKIKSQTICSPLLQISIIDSGSNFQFSDNFRKILVDEVNQCFKNIIEESRKIPRPQFYLREEANSYLWSINEDDSIYTESLDYILQIVEENCVQIQKIRQKFQQFREVLKFKDETLEWLKCFRDYEEIVHKISQIQEFSKKISQIPFYEGNKMVIIQCFEEKKKLASYMTNLRCLMYQNLQASIKKGNSRIHTAIDEIRKKISAPIQNTTDYLTISSDLEGIKKNELSKIREQMQKNKRILLKLQNMDYGFTQSELMQNIFKTYVLEQSLTKKITFHEERISKEKIVLQSELRNKILHFQNQTSTQLKTTTTRIDEFQLRRLYTEYLNQFKQFKSVVEENQKKINELNKQEEDLRWPKNTFTSAQQLRDLVEPNNQLWMLVSEYDGLMREWRNLELCSMDVNEVKKRITNIDEKISKIIKKLKNLSSLKIGYELQNDTKQILQQQVKIIEIFSHAGLKDKHWQLFNTKLMIPGIDLKEITYSKMKIFYDYEKNLKVLAVISNQAAKQFQLQTQKNEQQEYWNTISFQTYTNTYDNNFCISDRFFSASISVIEDHSNRLLVMKNSLYSKSLHQQLAEWEVWLQNTKKVMVNLQKAQKQLLFVKPIFTFEQISKQLAVQFSEFEAVESCWKSIIKKIWEYPHINDFMKSPRLSDLLDEINKKLQTIIKGIPIYLKIKRLEFPRFFFVDDAKLIEIISLSAYSVFEKKSIQIAFEQCFASSLSLKQNDDKFLEINSSIDKLQLDCDVFSVKVKKKICENMNLLKKSMSTVLMNQIHSLQLFTLSEMDEGVLNNYSLTALYITSQVQFTNQLKKCIENGQYEQLLEAKKQMIKNFLPNHQNINFNKFDKFLLVLLSQFEKILNFKKKNISSLEDYQYLREIKFLAKNQNDQVLTKNTPKKKRQSKAMLSRACGKITNMRRMSMIKLEKADSLEVQIFKKKIKYGEEFWGDEICTFIPDFALQPMVRALYQLSQNSIINMFTSQSSNFVYCFSTICGKFFKEVDCNFKQSYSFNNILQGIVCSSGWIHLQNAKNLQQEKIQLLCDVSSEIKEKKRQFILEKDDQKTIAPTYFNSLTCLLDLNLQGGCFLNLSTESSYKKLPDKITLSMRNLSLKRPDVIQFKKDIEEEIEFDKLWKCKYLLERCQFFKIIKSEEKTKFKKQILKLIKQENHLQLLKTILIDSHNIEKEQILGHFSPFLSTTKEQTEEDEEKQIQNEQCVNDLNFFIEKKKEELSLAFETNKTILLVGDSDNKGEIIEKVLAEIKFYQKIEKNKYSYPLSTVMKDPFLHLSYIVNQIFFQYNRICKSRQKQQKTIYIYLQYALQIEEQTLKIVDQTLMKIIEEKNAIPLQKTDFSEENQIKIVLIYDCTGISKLSPQTVHSVGKIFVNLPDDLCLSHAYRNWYFRDEVVTGEGIMDKKIFINQIFSFEERFFAILKAVMKGLSGKLFGSVVKTKLTLINNFLTMFSIYLQNLHNKDLDDPTDFDYKSYVESSFIYCAYWTLCIGYLDQYQHSIIEELILHELFPQIDDIQCISEYMLNEENEWLKWSNLLEDFGTMENKNLPIYQLWVSTEQNMKLYTNIIKFIEKNVSIMIIGKKCSGKSTLLKEISNFQMSYSSFLIDCQRHTQAHQISHCMKNKIIYGKIQNNLILIDDVNLPLKEAEVVSIFQKILQNKIIVNELKSGCYYPMTHKLGKPCLLLTISAEDSLSFYHLRNQLQGIKIGSLSQKEVTTIMKSYIEGELMKLNVFEELGSISNSSIKFLKQFWQKFTFVNVHKLFKVLKILLTKLYLKYRNGINIPENGVVQEKFKLQFVEILNFSLYSAFKDSQNLQDIQKYCHEQTNKLLTPKLSKSSNNFKDQVWKQLCCDLPSSISVPEKPHSEIEGIIKLIQETIQTYFSSKDEGSTFYCTKFHAEVILKVLVLLKISPSHFIIVSDFRSGIRTMIKLSTTLLNFGFTEVESSEPDNFLKQALNIIKTGGKIDESSYYLSKGMFKQNNEPNQILKMVSSFITSCQMYQFFKEEQIDQIFIKFSSEKKTLKKSEFIKKIKEKINLLFHFCLCVSTKEFLLLRQNFPPLVDQAFIIPVSKWPEESLYSIGQKVLNNSKIQFKQGKNKILSTLTGINNIFLTQFYPQKTLPSIIFKDTKAIQFFTSFENIMKKINSASNIEEIKSEVWLVKIEENQIKLSNLKEEKENIVEKNQSYFKMSYTKKLELEQKKRKQEFKRAAVKKVQGQLKVNYERIHSLQNEIYEKYITWEEYNEVIFYEEQLQKFGEKQFENLINQPEFFEGVKILTKQKNLSYDPKTCILEEISSIKDYKKNKSEEVVKELFEQFQVSQNKSYTGIFQNFVNWLQSLKLLGEKFQIYEALLSEQNEKRPEIEKKLSVLEGQQSEIQNELKSLEKENEETSAEDLKKQQQLEDINQSIHQTQSIINILQHFYQLIKSKKKRDKNQNDHSSKIGNFILVAVLMEYGFFFKQKELTSFVEKVMNLLIKNNWEIEKNSSTLLPLLKKWNQVKYEYLYPDNSSNRSINHFIILQNVCTVFSVRDREEVFEMTQWLDNLFEEKKKIIEVEDMKMVRNCLSNGQFGIIINPSKQFVEKLKPLIENDADVKNNTVFINLQEQTILNPNSRMIFIYMEEKIEQGLFHPLLRKNINCIKCLKYNYQGLSFPTKQSLKKRIKSMLKKQNEKEDLILKYNELNNDLNVIDEKIETVLHAIRKQIDNPDNIIMKIQSISKSKAKIQTQLETVIQNLKFYDKNQKQREENDSHNIPERSENLANQIITKNEKKGSQFNLSQSLKFLQIAKDNYVKEGYDKVIEKFLLFIHTVYEERSEKNNVNKHDQWKEILQILLQSKSVKSSRQQNRKKKERQCIMAIFKTKLPNISQEFLVLLIQEIKLELQYIDLVEIFQSPLKYSSFNNKVGIIKIESEKNWKKLQILNQDFKQKNINIKFLIICDHDIDVPFQIEQKSITMKNNWELENYLSKIKSKYQVFSTENLQPIYEKIKYSEKKDTNDVKNLQIIRDALRNEELKENEKFQWMEELLQK